MIFGLTDQNSDGESNPQYDSLDTQIQSLRKEIKYFKNQIQVKEAENAINSQGNSDKKEKELKELQKQVDTLKQSNDFELSRIQKAQIQINYLENQQVDLPPNDNSEDILRQINSQNELITNELNLVRTALANEVGEDFDIGQILQTGGSAKKRAEELQKLQAIFAKSQSAFANTRRTKELNKVANKVQNEIIKLLSEKAKMKDEIEEMKNLIQTNRVKCDDLEEANRALRMMDVLLTEKIDHDKELLTHLENEPQREGIQVDDDIPELSVSFIDQLLAQQMIFKGICYKLGNAQAQLSSLEIDNSFLHLVEQLNQMNKRCIDLQNQIINREKQETESILNYLEMQESQDFF